MSQYKALWQGSLIRVFEYVLDIFVMVLSFFTVIQIDMFFAYNEFFTWDLIIGLYWYHYWQIAAVYLLATAFMFKMYQTTLINNSFRNALQSTFAAILFMNTPLILFGFINPTNFIFSTPYYTFLVVGVEFILYAIYKYLFYRILGHFNRQEVLMIGPKNEVLELAKKFLLTQDRSKKIKYLIYVEPNQVLDESIYCYIDEVDIVFITESLDMNNKEFILDHASFTNFKEVIVVPKKTDIFLLKSKFDTLDDAMLLRSQNMHLSFEMRFIKRTIDLIVSILGLIIFAVPMLLVALIVKLQDGGPVFYKQERFKRNNEPFYIYKFRSMTHKQTYEMEQTLATHNDPRITKFGRIIRATRLDELPQLFNVLKGDMTLVGPRPFMKSVVDEAMDKNPDFRYRSNVKPGITGLSHVYGRYDTTPEERLRYDLLYVRQCNLWLDIKIMFLTIIIIFNKEAGLGRSRELSFEELLNEKGRALTKVDHQLYDIFLVSNK
jgi:exopolysaccharide biosynthesis polyprenyl glycosylphosphotransferase